MKKVYWRPKTVSRAALLLVAGMALAGLTAVEKFQIRTQQSYYQEKLAAAQLASEAMDFLKAQRLQNGPPIDPVSDPTESGLIGLAMTPVTSDPGVLSSKQTSVNPNFAAVIVEMLKQALVRKGDTVAVGSSGSFPALNVCVYSALQTLELKPVIISSAAASQWGANLPDFLWLDMERLLHESHKFEFRSVAASVGGVEDRALGMSEDGRQLLKAGIERNGLEMINPKTFAESITRRMAIYHQQAKASPIKAYINVGGGTISVGTRVGKRMFDPGLNLHAPPSAKMIESVMNSFANEGVPVIHLVQIEHLAAHYGLPVQPTTMPPVGEGKVFFRAEYNLWLAGGVLAAILLSLYGFIRSELGYFLLQGSQRAKDKVSHEPMI